MNERGIITLTALCVMFLLAITIAGISNIAARQADITRYYQIESKLRDAAESAFNRTVEKIVNDTDSQHTYNGNLWTDTKVENWSYSWDKIKINPSEEIDIDDVKIKVYLRKYKITLYDNPNAGEYTNKLRIVILIYAEMNNFTQGNYPLYKKVYGYMERNVIRQRETDNLVNQDENYKFKRYIY